VEEKPKVELCFARPMLLPDGLLCPGVALGMVISSLPSLLAIAFDYPF
jgi:hypothetical protein